MRLKPKHGYYRTDRYPLGGDFHRAPADGKEIVKILHVFPQNLLRKCHGTHMEVLFDDGTTGAVDRDHVEGGESEMKAIEIIIAENEAVQKHFDSTGEEVPPKTALAESK